MHIDEIDEGQIVGRGESTRHSLSPVLKTERQRRQPAAGSVSAEYQRFERRNDRLKANDQRMHERKRVLQLPPSR
jgi:hypothetical protein